MHFFRDTIHILAEFWSFNLWEILKIFDVFLNNVFRVKKWEGKNWRSPGIWYRYKLKHPSFPKYFSWYSYFYYFVMQKWSNETRSIPCNVCVDLECTRQSHLHYQMPQWNQPNQSLSPNIFVQFSSSLFPKLSNKYQKENSFPRLAACSITVQWRTL